MDCPTMMGIQETNGRSIFQNSTFEMGTPMKDVNSGTWSFLVGPRGPASNQTLSKVLMQLEPDSSQGTCLKNIADMPLQADGKVGKTN